VVSLFLPAPVLGAAAWRVRPFGLLHVDAGIERSAYRVARAAGFSRRPLTSGLSTTEEEARGGSRPATEASHGNLELTRVFFMKTAEKG
jgi:hypothetical protein